MDKDALRAKLLKNSTIKETDILSGSKFFDDKPFTPTPVPMINAALCGDVDGGLQPGILTLAGPSKHFKTAFSLLFAASFLKKYEDGIILFYDTEFGTPHSYFDSFGINKERVVHTPLMNIEQMKHDVVTQLEGLSRGDHVMIIIDSIGNIASKKEVEDAIKGNDAADMTRAKQLKSFGRMITPYLTTKNIPLICVNHVYQTQETYSKTVVSGGTGMYLSSDNIWILGRQKDKEEGKALEGYHFIINIEKSRYVREGTKIPITVSFDGGIRRWSGLFDVAKAGKFIAMPTNGWYSVCDPETGEVEDKKYRKDDIEHNPDFWNMMLKTTKLKSYIRDTFTLAQGDMLEEDKSAGAE